MARSFGSWLARALTDETLTAEVARRLRRRAAALIPEPRAEPAPGAEPETPNAAGTK